MILPNIVSRRTAGADLLRLVLCAILFTHGAYRFYDGTVPVLGDILHEEGLPWGNVLAYLVDLAEVVRNQFGGRAVIHQLGEPT